MTESVKKELLGKLLVSAKHKLDNLIILIDYNKIQALSKLDDAIPLHNLVKKLDPLILIA